MNRTIKLLLGLLWAAVAPGFAQDAQTAEDQEAAYIRVTNQRADKIVATLDIEDASKALRVRDMIAQQYRDLSKIHDARDVGIKAAEKQAGEDKEAVEARIKTIKNKANARLDKLHDKYISNLSKELTPRQVDQVKDGMTYGVVPITYKGYLAMLPDLTEQQKEKIMDYLVEAREHAMDAGSSEKKHYWFGQYKGKINNYLSGEGYDLKKAGEEWQKRREASADDN